MGMIMPVNIRKKGTELLQKGVYDILDDDPDYIKGLIDGIKVNCFYGDDYDCECNYFMNHGYCKHVAALEAYIKSKDEKHKERHEQKVSKLKVQTEEPTVFKQKPVKKEPTEGALFVEDLILPSDRVETKGFFYHLEIYGDVMDNDDVRWQLKVYRPDKKRSYVVRSISTFLRALSCGHDISLSNQVLEIGLEDFEPRSREILEYLISISSIDDQGYTYIPFASNITTHDHRHLNFHTKVYLQFLNLIKDYPYLVLDTHMGSNYHHIAIEPYEPNGDIVSFTITEHHNVINLKANGYQPTYYPLAGLIRDENRFLILDDDQNLLARQIFNEDFYRFNRPLKFDISERALLTDIIEDLELLGPVEAPEHYRVQEFTPEFHFEKGPNQSLKLSLHFRFDQEEVISQQQLDELNFSYRHKKAQLVFSTLDKWGFPEEFTSRTTFNTAKKQFHFYNKIVPSLEEIGEVYLSPELEEGITYEDVDLEINQLGGLLNISFNFDNIGETDVQEASQALLDQQQYFIDHAGRLRIFNQKTRDMTNHLKHFNPKDNKDGQVTFSKVEALRLEAALGDFENAHFTESFKELAHALTHPEETVLPDLNVKADLRDYQLHGVKWLTTLYQHGLGGLLADDMGLGKTLQTIAFLSGHLKPEQSVLILSPASLIYNWKDEFEKFAPHLDVAVSYGGKEERSEILNEKHQIILTSYPSFRQDEDFFKDYPVDILVLDEAQAVKNTQTKIAANLKKFKAKTVFALSGTPIENRLEELWSIFEIVLPDLFPGKRAFKKLETETIGKMINPFLLRRHKEDVLTELPDLIEKTYTNELNSKQKAIYLAQLRQMQDTIAGQTDAEINRQKIQILTGLTRLRQICDSPQLFLEDYTGKSGKMKSLLELLETLRANGRRPLIFSQFTGMLALVEEELENRGYDFFTLTGSTPSHKRQSMTHAFNRGKKDCFLISLKAGGVGLNLTGADTVILIDLWWNPAVEMQAISRAHRLGQTQKVEVFRLITEGTIEESILHMQEQKRDLVTDVLDGEAAQSSLTVEEIKEILGIEN